MMNQHYQKEVKLIPHQEQSPTLQLFPKLHLSSSCAEPHLQDRRDHRPDPTAQGTTNDHQRKDVPRLKRIEGQTDTRADNGAHDVLPFSTDVPDPRPEAQGQTDGDQHNGQDQVQADQIKSRC